MNMIYFHLEKQKTLISGILSMVKQKANFIT